MDNTINIRNKCLQLEIIAPSRSPLDLFPRFY